MEKKRIDAPCLEVSNLEIGDVEDPSKTELDLAELFCPEKLSLLDLVREEEQKIYAEINPIVIEGLKASKNQFEFVQVLMPTEISMRKFLEIVSKIGIVSPENSICKVCRESIIYLLEDLKIELIKH